MKGIYLLILTLVFCGCQEETSTSEWFETRKELIQDRVDDEISGYMLLRYLDDSEETTGLEDLNNYLQLKGIRLEEGKYTSITCKKTESGLSLHIDKQAIWGTLEVLVYEIPNESLHHWKNELNKLNKTIVSTPEAALLM
jgi:hypothetical protein